MHETVTTFQDVSVGSRPSLLRNLATNLHGQPLSSSVGTACEVDEVYRTPQTYVLEDNEGKCAFLASCSPAGCGVDHLLSRARGGTMMRTRRVGPSLPRGFVTHEYCGGGSIPIVSFALASNLLQISLTSSAVLVSIPRTANGCHSKP